MCVCYAVTKHVLRNVALNERSYQVSTMTDRYGSHGAGLANDGRRQTTLNRCAQSLRENNPWWAVDLEVPTLVARVDLTNGDAYGTDVDFTVFRLYVRCI